MHGQVFSAAGTRDSRLELRQERAFAQHHRVVLGLSPFENFAINTALEINYNPIAIFCGLVDGFKTGSLLTQSLNRAINISVDHFGLLALDG